MHVFKWTNPRFYLCFSPDGDGAPATPTGGGDSGSSVPASTSAGDTGGSAAPPSPAPDTGGAPPAPAADAPSPWAQLGSNDDLDNPTIPEIAPVVPPVAPVVPAATPPVQQTQPPQAPPVQPGAPTPQADGPAAPPLSPSDPVGIATAIEQNRDAVIAHLAQTKFALTEADVQELETDVTTAVPKLLGRVFMESQVAMQKFLAQAVPGMIRNFQTVTTANEGAEKQFFEAHKATGLDMNNPQHRAVTSRIASLYRQANPGIKLDQLIADVGPMVVASLARSGVQVAAPAPQTPGAPPVMPRGGTPFRPAVNGGGGAPPVPAADPNPWSGLGQEFE